MPGYILVRLPTASMLTPVWLPRGKMSAVDGKLPFFFFCISLHGFDEFDVAWLSTVYRSTLVPVTN